jgi:shikimate dehydrogenase
MQNAGIAALGLDWRYLAFDVWPDQLGEAIRGAQRMNFIGLNLTVPHKVLALNIVDKVEEAAEVWGAVNTIVFEGRAPTGEWRPLREFEASPSETRSHGFNTDADAIVRSVQEELGLPVRGARILLLGAGGAGRTAALKLASEGAAEMYLVNRTLSKAEEVGREMVQRYPATVVRTGYPSGRVDLVLNATSLGLAADDPMPLDETQFPLSRAGAVYDMIYRPATTRLLTAARDAGCPTANGLGMLLYQGARALELWTGQKPPIEVMRQALRTHIYPT